MGEVLKKPSGVEDRVLQSKRTLSTASIIEKIMRREGAGMDGREEEGG